MTQSTRLRRPRRLTAAASLAFAFALTTCDRPAVGPGGRASLAVAVVMPASTDLALFNLTIDNVRLIVVRPPADTVFDQVIPFPANQTELSIEAEIPLEVSPETFQVTIELLSGTQVLFSGTQDISLSEGTDNPPAQLPVTYSGPGQNVATLTIAPVDSALSFGTSLTFRPTARDGQGNVVQNFYVAWSTSDPAVPIDATGTITAPSQRVNVIVTARTPTTPSAPNGITASTPITIVPVPIAINIVSGCGQSGSPGAPLLQPIVARVIAGDGFGVKGIQVQFTAPVGGSVSTPLVVTDDNGLAQTFATLPLQGPAAFSIGATGLTTVPCSQTVLGATQLVFTLQPSNNPPIVAGSPFSVVVVAQDALGSPVTSFTSNVTLALGVNPGGVTFGATVPAVAGVATFGNLTITAAGVGYTLVATSGSLTSATSNPFDVTAGAVTQLSVVVTPPAVTAGTPATIVVTAQDGSGATVTGYLGTVHFTSTDQQATLPSDYTFIAGDNGTHSFAAGATLRTQGTQAVTATDVVTSSITGSGSVSVTAAGAADLVFTVQPSAIAAGANFNPAVLVTAQDAFGNTATSFAGTVSLAIGTNPGGAVLLFTTAVSAAAGVASFANVSLDKVGTGYTLVASSVSLTSAPSAAFNVTAGAATQLTFLVQPSTVTQGGIIAPPVQVAIQDQFGNTVLTATDFVTMTIGANPGSATLGGAGPVSASTGIASFGSLTVSAPGSGYTLMASATGLGTVESAPFGVLPVASGIAWNNPAGGNWSVASNWSPAQVPGKTDTVFITLAGTYTVTLDVNDTVAFLTVGGASGAQTLVATNRTFGIDSAATLLSTATLNLTNTTINGGANLVSGGTIGVSPGTSAINATVTVNAGGLSRQNGNNGPASLTVNGGFSNAGTLELTGTSWGGQLTVSGTLTNAVGATLRALNGASNSITGVLNNQGSVLVEGPLTLNGVSADHLNGGTITLGVGNLTLSQTGTTPSFTTTGSVVVGTGRVLQVNGGAFNYANANPGGLAGLGTVNFSGATLNLTPELTHDTLTLSLTNTTVNGPGTLTVAGPSTLVLAGSTINAPVVNQGTLQANPGTNAFNGTVANQGGALLRLLGNNGPATVTLGAGFTNLGTTELTGTSWGGQLTVSGTLTNAGGATLRALNGANNAVTGVLDNQGAVLVDGPLTLNGVSADHLNSGTITLGLGNLTLSQTGTTPTFTTTGTIVVGVGRTWLVSGGALDYAGGSIGGSGALSLSGATLGLGVSLTHDTLTLNLTNTTVNGPGTLTVAGPSTLVLAGSTINAPLVNQGTLQANPGTNAFNGTVANQGGALLRLLGNNGPATVTVGAGFTNQGTLELTGTSWGGQLTVSGTLTNAGGATLRALNGANNAVTGALDNQGAVLVDGPLTLNGVSADHMNSGTITLGVGNLTLSQSGTTPSFTTTGTISVGVGRTWSVSGGALDYTGGSIGGSGALSLSGVALGLGVSLTHDTLTLSLTNTTVNGPGTLTVAGPSTLVLAGSTINAPLVNQGTLQANPGTNAFNGTVANQGGALLRLLGNNGPATVTVGAGFTNQSTIELTGTSWGGQLTVSGTLTNAGGATLRALNGASNTVTGALDNQGTLQVDGPLTVNGVSADHMNSGTITLGAGNLNLSQSGTTPTFTTTGIVLVGTGRTWTVNGGALDFAGGAIGGDGTMALTGVTLGLAVTLTHDTLPVSLTVSLTNSTVNGPGVLPVSGSSTLSLTGTTVNAPLVNFGTLQAAPGTNVLNGTVANQGGALLRLLGNNGPATVTVGAGFTNQGTIELTGTSWGGQLTVSGTLTNASGATLQALNGANNAVTGVLDNQGTVLVDGPFTLNGVSADHLNSGTITLGLGNLTLSQSGTTPTFANDGILEIGVSRTVTVTGGTFTNNAAGTLLGTGTLNVAGTTFSNVGSVNPGTSPGILTVTGAFPATSGSVLNFELGGLTPGTQHDRLAVSGAATLGGLLNVTLLPGFTPAVNDQFTILTYGSQTGTFSSVNLPPGMQFSIGATAVVVTFVGGTTPVNSWINASGGTWNSPGSWSTGVVPAAGDSVIIGLSGTYTVTLDVNPTVAYLTIGGGSGVQTFSSTSHTLTVNGATVVASSGTFVLTNSTLTGGGSVLNQGTVHVTGTSAINGSYTSGTGSLLRVQGNGTQGSGTLTMATGFTNNGTIELTNADPSFQRTAQLNVTTGTLLNPATRTIAALVGTLGGARVLNARLDNQGTVSVTSAQGLTSTTTGTAHANSGTIDLSGGSFTVNQSGTSSFANSGSIQLTGGSFSLSQGSGGTLATTGGVTIGAGRTFSVTGGTFNVNTGSSITGAGTLALSSTTVNLTPNFDNGLTALTLSSSTLNGPGTLTNTTGKTLVLLNSTLGATLPFINQGTVLVHGTSAINGSYTSGTGSTLRMEGNGTQGNGTLTMATGFTNNGAIELTNADPSFQRTAQLNVTAGTLQNPATRTIAALVGTMGGTRVLNAQLNNQGTLSVVTAQGLTSTTTGTSHSNSGTIDLSGGSFTVNQSGTSSFTNSGPIQLTGGSFSLSQGSGGTLATTGSVTIGTGRTFSVTGGTFNVNTGSSITGAGSLALSSTTANLTPNFDNGLTALTLSSSTVNGPGTLTNTTGKTLVLLNSTLGATLPFINQATVLVHGTSAINGSYTSGTGSTLRMEGNGTQGNATLTVATGFTNNGSIELTNADPSFQRNAGLNVTAGTLQNPATRTIAALVGTMGGTRTLNAQLANQGTLSVATAQGLTSTTAGTAHTNSGTIDLSGGSFTVNQSGTSSFTNSGPIQLTGGTFSLSQGSGGTLATTGAVTIGTGRTFSVTGGTFNVNTGSSITGAGTLALSSTTVNLTPTFDNGLTALTLSSSTVNGPGTLTNTTGKTLLLLNSTLGATLPFVNQGTVVVTNTSAINGTYTSGSGSTLRMEGNGTQGNATLTMATGFTNNGAIELTNVDPTFARIARLDVTAGTLVNAPTRTIASLVGTNGGTRTLNAQLDNQGTLTVAQSLTVNKLDADHQNAGLIKLAGGDLTVSLSGFRPAFTNTTGTIDVGTNKFIVTGSGTFLNNGSAAQGNGTLMGSGTFDLGPSVSFITNGTTVVGSSPGILNFPGRPYLQGPDPSVLKVEIGGNGSAPGTEYDQLQSADNVTLQGGTLDVTLIGPVAGQTYVIMQLPAGKTITGDFQTKLGLVVPKCVAGASGTAYLIVCP